MPVEKSSYYFSPEATSHHSHPLLLSGHRTHRQQRSSLTQTRTCTGVKNTSHNRGNGVTSRVSTAEHFTVLTHSKIFAVWNAEKTTLLSPILSIPKGPIRTFPLTLPKMQPNFKPRGCCLTNTLLKEWHEKYFAATGDLLENYIKSQYSFAKSLNFATYIQGTVRAAAIHLKKNKVGKKKSSFFFFYVVLNCFSHS